MDDNMKFISNLIPLGEKAYGYRKDQSKRFSR